MAIWGVLRGKRERDRSRVVCDEKWLLCCDYGHRLFWKRKNMKIMKNTEMVVDIARDAVNVVADFIPYCSQIIDLAAGLVKTARERRFIYFLTRLNQVEGVGKGKRREKELKN